MPPHMVTCLDRPIAGAGGPSPLPPASPALPSASASVVHAIVPCVCLWGGLWGDATKFFAHDYAYDRGAV